MRNPIRLHWLDPRDPQQPFPAPGLALRDPNGLLAIGGDLSPVRLLGAYAQGIFPWYNPDEPILWWCPDPRAVLEPRAFHVSRSLGRRLRRADHAVTMNRDFAAVLDGCSAPRPRSGGGRTWLGPEMKQAYLELHRLGHAQSVEVWHQGRLAGGVYGVSFGRVFYGESMFSRMTDASKIALYWLCRQLAAWDYELLDCQVASAHLATLGAREIPRGEFLARIRTATAQPGRPGRWDFTLDVPRAAGALP